MIQGSHKVLVPSWFARHGMTRQENKNGATVVWLHHSADPVKDDAWAKDFSKTFPGGREGGPWRSEMDGEPDAYGGKRVFPDFNEATHVIKPLEDIPGEWPKYRVIDPGLDHALACCFYVLDPFNEMLIQFDEHVQDGWPEIARHASVIKAKSAKYVFEYTLLDSSAFAKTLAGEGRSVATLFMDHGITVSPASRIDKIAQIAALADLIMLNGTEPRFKVTSNCEVTIDMLKKYKWMPQLHEDRESPQKPVKIYDDAIDCVTGDTMVSVPGGERLVTDLASGDLVMTRNGPRRVIAAWMKSEALPTWEVRHERGTLRATPDHLIWTQRGWVPLCELTTLDTMLGCESTSRASGSEEFSTADTHDSRTFGPESPIESEASTHCIETSGERLTERSRRGWSSTIATETLSTTTSPTSNSWIRGSTQANMVANGLQSASSGNVPISTEFEDWLLSGTEVMSEGSGTRSTLKKYGPDARTEPSFVKYAATRGELGTEASSDGAPWSAPKSRCGVSVVAKPCPTGLSEPVYDIAVDGDHEFFANGVLVHNCALYLAVALDVKRKSLEQRRHDPLAPWYRGSDRKRLAADTRRIQQNFKDWTEEEP